MAIRREAISTSFASVASGKISRATALGYQASHIKARDSVIAQTRDRVSSYLKRAESIDQAPFARKPDHNDDNEDPENEWQDIKTQHKELEPPSSKQCIDKLLLKSVYSGQIFNVDRLLEAGADPKTG